MSLLGCTDHVQKQDSMWKLLDVEPVIAVDPFLGCTHLCVLALQELLEEEAANAKPIEDLIEEERRKVDARTPITEEVGCRASTAAAESLLQLHVHSMFRVDTVALPASCSSEQPVIVEGSVN